jgi:hypothetical protein
LPQSSAALPAIIYIAKLQYPLHNRVKRKEGRKLGFGGDFSRLAAPQYLFLLHTYYDEYNKTQNRQQHCPKAKTLLISLLITIGNFSFPQNFSPTAQNVH